MSDKDTSKDNVDDKKSDDESKDEKTVSAAEYEKLQSELKSLKKNSKDVEKRLADALKQIDDSKESTEQEKGNFKKLYESERVKNQEWEKKHAKLKDSVVHNEKFKAVQSKLLESGLRKDAVSILEKEDLADVEHEFTSEGRIIVHGVDDFADSFKKKYSFAFEDKKTPRVNAGGGSGPGKETGQIDGKKLFEIERKHGAKSEEYQAALKTFAEQRAKRK